MTFRAGALIIITVTTALMALLNFALNVESDEIAKPSTIEIKKKDDGKEKIKHLEPAKPKSPAAVKKDEEEIDELDDDFDDDDGEDFDDVDLSQEDIAAINSVANLSDAELSKELDALKTQVRDEDIFEKLDAGELTEQEEKDAKALVERFALLGVEESRRKFMNIEPELKDAIYAHRETLREIRELLSEEF